MMAVCSHQCLPYGLTMAAVTNMLRQQVSLLWPVIQFSPCTTLPVARPVLKAPSVSGFNTSIGIFFTYLMTSLVFWPLNKDSVMSVN